MQVYIIRDISLFARVLRIAAGRRLVGVKFIKFPLRLNWAPLGSQQWRLLAKHDPALDLSFVVAFLTHLRRWC